MSDKRFDQGRGKAKNSVKKKWVGSKKHIKKKTTDRKTKKTTTKKTQKKKKKKKKRKKKGNRKNQAADIAAPNRNLSKSVCATNTKGFDAVSAMPISK